MDAPDSTETLENELWTIIERQLLAFERAWRNSDSPDIAGYLNLDGSESVCMHQRSRNSQQRLLIELIKIDLEHRWSRGQRQKVESYIANYPDLRDGQCRDEIIESEIEARAIVGQLPSDEEIAKRFDDNQEHWIALVSRLRPMTDPKHVPSVQAKSRLQRDANTTDLPSIVGINAGDLRADGKIDRYVLKQKIGQGTFSVVWRAIDVQLKRDVALKILRSDRIEHDDSIVPRLIREGRAAALIDHPGVVKIHEVISHDSSTYIVQEFVDGPTLKDIIEESTPTIIDSVNIVLGICRAVDAGHVAGVIHRDIKPANILLKNGKTPMLVDFGLAYLDQFTDTILTQQGELLGTPAYMSPEQALGQSHRVDIRSDIYSIGAVLYHLLAGLVPFDGSMLSVLDDVVHKSPNRAPLSKRSIDRDLETIVLKCLEKDPDDRYPSAALLADDLQRYLDGLPIQARPVGVFEKAWKWAKRHPRWTATLSGIFLLMAFLLGTLIQLQSVNSQRHRAETAEKRSQGLLLESTCSAGRLAMQRGKMQLAVELLRQAQRLATTSDPELTLDLVESLIATRDIQNANQAMAGLSLGKLPDQLRGRGRMLSAHLELESSNIESAEKEFERAIKESLSPSHSNYVDAMLSDDSLTAVKKLKQSLDFEPLSHQPRRMLITMLISLAEFEKAENQLGIAQQLFPGDVDFQLLQAILFASTERLEQANELIKNSALDDNQKRRWSKVCTELSDFRSTYNHRESEFGFNHDSLMRLCRMYSRDVGPCLSERGFVFPPKIAKHLSVFFECLNSYSDGKIDLSETWPELKSVVEVHPEGSLIILDLSTLLHQDRIQEVLARCKSIPQARGFVRDSDEMLVEIQVTSAMIELTKPENQLARNAILKAGVEAFDQFESFPNLVERFSSNQKYCRITCVFLIEAFKSKVAEEALVLRWLQRLEAHPASDPQQVVWFKAVIANRARRPFDALDLLAELSQSSIRNNEPLSNGIGIPAQAMHDAIIQTLKHNTEKSKTIELKTKTP